MGIVVWGPGSRATASAFVLLQYWDLNSGLCAYEASVLSLELCFQPYLFLFDI
jgi:hypothetical protein